MTDGSDPLPERPKAQVRPQSLRVAVDSLPVLISQVDVNERYRFVNKAYSEWFGCPAEQIVGSTLISVLGPAAYANLKPWVEAALSGRTVHFETLADYRDAGVRYIEATYTPSFDPSGAVDGFYALVQDVTARRQTEEALALSEARLAAVLESVSDGFHAVDAEGRLTLMNAAAERFFGTSRDQVLGRRIFDVFPVMAGSVFEDILQAALRGEHPPPVEATSLIRPDRRVLVRAFPLTGGGMAVAFTDITSRWQAEVAQRASDQKAREQLEELEAIYETSPVGLAFLSEDLRFVRVNRRLAELNGVPAAAHVGRTVREVVPAISDQVDAVLARLSAGEEIVSYEITGETGAQPGMDGAWLEYWTPLRGPGGDIRGLNVVVEDITERKKAEAQTRLLIDELNHRVKNTLSVVQNLARQSFRGGDGALRAARDAFEQRLLALAAAHTVLTQRRWEPVGLHELAATATGGAEQRIALQGPDVDVGPDVAVALSLALHELATNARKYGALSVESGEVQLHWALSGERILLRWSEHGGPPVHPPLRRGFGTRLLERAMDGVAGGDAALSFPTSGVVCEIAFLAATPVAAHVQAGRSP